MFKDLSPFDPVSFLVDGPVSLFSVFRMRLFELSSHAGKLFNRGGL